MCFDLCSGVLTNQESTAVHITTPFWGDYQLIRSVVLICVNQPGCGALSVEGFIKSPILIFFFDQMSVRTLIRKLRARVRKSYERLREKRAEARARREDRKREDVDGELHWDWTR